MAFKTFSAGDVLTASDVNTYLMGQAVITCTSATRPASPSEGMTIYETDTDRFYGYSGSAWEVLSRIGAWQSWTPALGSYGAGTDWALGDGTVSGVYQRVGRMVVAQFLITFGSTTTFGTKFLTVSTPATMRTYSGTNHALGIARLYDVSVTTGYLAEIAYYSPTTVSLAALAAGGSFASMDAVKSTTPMTWQSSDQISGTFIFEAAS